jgi:hypothetical protein
MGLYIYIYIYIYIHIYTDLLFSHLALRHGAVALFYLLLFIKTCWVRILRLAMERLRIDSLFLRIIFSLLLSKVLRTEERQMRREKNKKNIVGADHLLVVALSKVLHTENN